MPQKNEEPIVLPNKKAYPTGNVPITETKHMMMMTLQYVEKVFKSFYQDIIDY